MGSSTRSRVSSVAVLLLGSGSTVIALTVTLLVNNPGSNPTPSTVTSTAPLTGI